MKLGITERSFWSMDFGEAVRAVKYAAERQKQEMQWQAELAYKTALLNTIGVNRQLGGREEWPTIEKAFPGLFDDEKLQEERELKKAQAWGERFKAVAEVWNQKMEMQNGNRDT